MKTLFAASGCASTRRLVTLGLALAAAAVSLAAAPAHAQSCQDLWTERNGYYQANGYCFKTARAIRYFGNGGCNPRLTEGSVTVGPRACRRDRAPRAAPGMQRLIHFRRRTAEAAFAFAKAAAGA
jgi:hypothetical protein